MGNIITILVGAILVNNFVMSRFLGICPFLGVSKKIETAFGMGVAVTFVMTLASFITYIVQYYLLEPLNLAYLQTIAFIVVIAVLVQVVEMALKKLSYGLYKALGVYLPLITTNCAVLGVALLNMTATITDAATGLERSYNLIESTFNGFGAGLGFTLVIVLFAGIRERMELCDMPEWMDGFPGALVTAGLMSIAFMGFSGLIK